MVADRAIARGCLALLTRVLVAPGLCRIVVHDVRRDIPCIPAAGQFSGFLSIERQVIKSRC